MIDARTICKFEGCPVPAVGQGLCNVHYQREKRAGNLPDVVRPPKPTCSHEGCDRVSKTRGLCGAHYQSYRSSGKLPLQRGFSARRASDGSPLPCQVPDCEQIVQSRGYCETHYRQWKRGETQFTRAHETDMCPTPDCFRGKSVRSRTCNRCKQFKTRYGLTWGLFDFLHDPKNKKCYNPGCPSDEDLHLDHDHACCPEKVRSVVSCGECVRGWLCRGCNWALGQLKEDPRRIEGLLTYLRDGGYASRR